jgi:cobalt/nickel transport protein
VAISRSKARTGGGTAPFRQTRAWLAAIAAGLTAAPAEAHFQMLYTAETALSAGQATEILMLFTHPAHGGPHMAMVQPEAFYVLSQRGEDAVIVRTDLARYLEPIAWESEQGPTSAYRAQLTRSVTRSLGDYVLVLEPGPYYEAGEDKYIQQFTKTMLNIGGVPGNWAEPVGLPAEILPLDKPYANWVGGVFRGVVLAAGEPVPNAELEVEYVNHAPDLARRRSADEPAVELPQASFGTMSIRANDRGEFSIGLPRAGWWGICALAVGPGTEHEGKELSQDAVLWVQAKEMR